MNYTLNIKLIKRLTLTLVLVVFYLALSPGVSQAQEVEHYCPSSGPTACQTQCTKEGHQVVGLPRPDINDNTGDIRGYWITCTGDFESIPTPVGTKFVPLVGIPGVNADANINDYINALYALSISLAALLAVIKIIIAGVKWMLSDMVTTISDAKKDIQGALLGLLIVISAVVVLNFINPQLTETDLFLAPVGQSANNTSGTNTTPEQPTLFCSSATTCAEIEARCRGVGGTPTTLPSIEEGDGGTITCDKPFGPPLPPRTTVVFPCNDTGEEPCLGAIFACALKTNSTYITRLVIDEDEIELLCSFPAQ